MRRIDDRTVELTNDEWLVSEFHDILMDRGLNQVSALAWLCQDEIPSGLQSHTPRLDKVLTPEFREYLSR